MTQYGPIQAIAPIHESDAFDCGSSDQTVWLRRHALQAHQSDTARVYVVCRGDTAQVVGYYALSAGSVASEEAPARVTKGVGRHPIAVIILARLGVDVGEQGRGLGTALVKDALLQVATVADGVGVRALLIHAETERAAAFYTRIDPGFERSPTDPLHVVLLIKDVRRAIRNAVVR